MQDVVRAPPGLKPACLEDVEGFASASPRQSLTTPAGTLRVAPIDGVPRGRCRITMGTSRKPSEPTGG